MVRKILWVFALGYSLSAAGSDDGYAFLYEVNQEISENCRGEIGVDYLNCRADYTPERCKGLVYSGNTQGWARCVYSCGLESTFSRTVGDCDD